MKKDIFSYHEKLNRVTIIVIGIVLVVLLGVIDFVSGYELSFSIFYLAPIAFVGWSAGRCEGLIVALLSAIVWLIADMASGRTFSSLFIPFWNAVVRLGFFTVVVLLLSKLQCIYAEQIRLVSELRKTIEQVKILSGLIPMCAWCKKIRDDQGYWQQVETYLTMHPKASLTHTICPDCKKNWEKELQTLSQ